MRRRQLFQALGAALLSPAIEKLSVVMPAPAAAAPACFVRGAVLQSDMFAVGFGVHLFAEPIAFSPVMAEPAVETTLKRGDDWTAPTWEEAWANSNTMLGSRS